MNTIMIVDDEVKIRNIYADYLKNRGFLTLEARDALSARAMLKEHSVSLVLLDINMPDIDGTEFFDVAQLFHKDLNVIVCSVRPIEEQKELIKGAADYHDKSEGLNKLLIKVTQALNQTAGGSQ